MKEVKSELKSIATTFTTGIVERKLFKDLRFWEREIPRI